jgi:hypothetical protein
MVLTGAAAALGAVTAEALGGIAPAQAAQGSPVLLGADNVGAAARTGVFTAGSKEWAQLADPGNPKLGSLGIYAHGQDFGVFADTEVTGNGTGLSGTGGGSGAGVSGMGGGGGGTGVHGIGGGGAGTGVVGDGDGGGGTGVFGTGGGPGTGVVGLGGGDGGGGVAGVGGTQGGIGVGGVGGNEGGIGVSGVGGTGVVGVPGGTGVSGQGGAHDGTGVSGAGDGSGDGVFGESVVGNGVHGKAGNALAVGVLAENTGGGAALKVTGRTVFSRSGTVTVRSGSSSVTRHRVALTGSSLVLATVQHDVPGVWVRCAVPDVAGGSFTVHLSKAVRTSTKVAWFVIG